MTKANDKTSATTSWTRSTCPYCGVGCGVEVAVANGRISKIRGDKSHPANFGKLCPKPTGLPEAVHSPNRLTHPMRRKANGETERVSWDSALDELAERLSETIQNHGSDSAAFYISGQLLTEDYYAVNKLAKGFLRTNNLDSNSRLCMTSAVEGVYRKAVIKNGKVVGAVLLGDVSAGAQMTNAVKTAMPAEEIAGLVTGNVDASSMPLELPDEAQVCDCNGVSKGEIVATIEDLKLRKVSDVVEKTRAGTGCGSCKPLVAEILSQTSDEMEEEKNHVCKCMSLGAEGIRNLVKERRLKSVSEVGETCGAGKVCPDCKPALTYLVSSTNLGGHKEERHARHINDRVHANIQNDGTFSIVPRTPGGVTNPDELRRIADVAEKYEARMVKITGAQRLDILGIKKEDLPKAWEDLGMKSGFAYTKAFRQVKTCVGTEFCRFGVGDSTKLGIEMEEEFENLYTPAKMKMAASGCPRNCAESSVKDIGVIAVEGGWQIYVGGAAGMDVRKGDVIATVETAEEAKNVMISFMQFYRENGNPKERTYDFVPRIGLEEIRSVILDEESGEPEKLRERLRAEKATTRDPWLERDENKTKNQFAGEVRR